MDTPAKTAWIPCRHRVARRAAVLVVLLAVGFALGGEGARAEGASADAGPRAGVSAPAAHDSRARRGTKRSARARRRAPSQAVVARRLATRVTRARTTKQREAAVLAVMRELRIGVYSSAGKAIVGGAERGRQSFYLYRFEVAAIAAALQRGQRFSADALAAELAAAGVARNGSPITGQQVADAIASGTRRFVARPRDRLALAPLLVRELGLRQRPRVDTRTPLPPAEAKLDALQRALFVADLAAGAHDRARRRGRASAAAPVAVAARQPSQGQRDKAGVCAFLGSDRTKSKGWQLGKWVFDKVVEETPVDKLVAPLTNLWHASFLGLLMDVQPTRGGQVLNTHYGPAVDHPGFVEPNRPGQELVFQVGVQLLGDIPDADVRCGKLLGLEFPNDGKKGPVADVPVDWDPLLGPDGYEQLMRHGTVVRKDERTGANGIAVLRVRPKDEVLPGIGPRAHEIGVIQPGVDVVGAFGNDVASVWELVAPRIATFAWTVEFHKPRGFRFRSTTDRICFFFGACNEFASRIQWTYEAGMCGPDPYDVPWRGKVTRSQIDFDEVGDETVREEPLEFVLFGDGKPSTWYPRYFEGRNDNRVDFTLVEGPPALMKVDAYYSNSFPPGDELHKTYEDHKQVAIEENPDCPEVP